MARGLLSRHPQEDVRDGYGGTLSMVGLIESIRDDRYQFYLATEKLCVYDLDASKHLSDFYAIARGELLEAAQEAEKSRDGDQYKLVNAAISKGSLSCRMVR